VHLLVDYQQYMEYYCVEDGVRVLFMVFMKGNKWQVF
jgi:uncharacterized membrane protein